MRDPSTILCVDDEPKPAGYEIDEAPRSDGESLGDQVEPIDCPSDGKSMPIDDEPKPAGY